MAYKEFRDSMKTSISDRFTSPLFGTFIISWCLWHYRILFVLFSELSITDKFSYIDNTLGQKDFWPQLTNFFFYPLITAIVFLVIYPFPARWIFWFWRIQQKKLALIRQKIEDETPLTLQEINVIKKEHSKTIDIFRSDLQRKDFEIDAYRTQLREAQESRASLQKSLDEAQGLPKNIDQSRFVTEQEMKSVLTSGKHRLHFNPQANASKIIELLPNGTIGEGKNNNEYTWRARNGKLELIQSDGKTHSRFNYFPDSKLLLHSNDEDTLSNPGQYITLGTSLK